MGKILACCVGMPIPTAAPLIPPRPTLNKLRDAAADCKACHLWKLGTQTVFGEGKSKAVILFVGEQPGDKEDLAGRPFVGPAGALFDAALEEVGIDRTQVYVTNVVKHFKWEPRGKRRLHKKPGAREISACRPWLEAEFDAVKPRAVICLGATAAQALLGRAFRITRQRGELLPFERAEWITATWHPSAVLRAPEQADRARMREELVEDLTRMADALKSKPSKVAGRRAHARA